MRKSNLQKCSYCLKEFRVLSSHTQWCKEKKRIEALNAKTISNWASKDEIDWKDAYYKAENKAITAEEKVRKSDKAVRACREAFSSISIAIARLMEIDL